MRPIGVPYQDEVNRFVYVCMHLACFWKTCGDISFLNISRDIGIQKGHRRDDGELSERPTMKSIGSGV